MYKHNGVYFDFPESWEVVDDDGDDIIRAITIECPNNGFYTMDIYNSAQAPSIEKYITGALKYFTKELPFGCKVINESTQQVEKAIYQNLEIEGLRVEFTVRTLFRKKNRYINSYFSVHSGNKVSIISSQYPVENAVKSQSGFNKILASYRLV